ncbi:MAG: hypothetical protein JO249_20145 [Acidobacteria bacterium]|nr:hypothetical protein [Acidobacteriota bacterium]
MQTENDWRTNSWMGAGDNREEGRVSKDLQNKINKWKKATSALANGDPWLEHVRRRYKFIWHAMQRHTSSQSRFCSHTSVKERGTWKAASIPLRGKERPRIKAFPQPGSDGRFP